MKTYQKISHILILSLFLIISHSIFAVSGKVVDSRTGTGIWGCFIKETKTGKSTRSDKNGFFTLPLDQTGGTLIFSIARYKTHAVAVPNNLNVNLKISLSPARPATMKKVIVSRKKEERVSVNRISSKQLLRKTTNLFPDTFKAIQMLPGVVAGDDFSSLMYIRGGSFYETIALLDDFIIINPYMWGGNTSVFNPNLVDSIDFYSGGFPSMYGQAMSGVLDISIKNGNPTNTSGYLEASLVTIEGLIEGPLSNDKKSSFIVGVRRTYYDLLLKSVMDAEEGTTLPFFYDGQAKFNIALNDKTFLNINTLVSYEGMNWKFSEEDANNADFEVSTNSEFYYKDLRIMQAARIKSALTDKLSFRGTIGYRFAKADYKFKDDDRPMKIDSKQHEIQARADIAYNVNKAITVDAGLYHLTLWTDMDLSIKQKVLLEQTTNINAIYYQTNIEFKYNNKAWSYYGSYASVKFNPNKWFLAQLGGRFEYFNVTEEFTAAPRFSSMFTLNKTTRLKLAAGVFKQYPFYTANGNALNEKYGNPDLKAETSYHAVVGFEKDLTKNISLRIEGFYKHYKDLVTSDPENNYLNEGERRSYGFDLFFQKKLSGSIDGWITYSYIKTDQRINNRSADIPGEPESIIPVGEWYAPEFSKSHNLAVVINMRLAPKWALAISYKFSTGNPYTPITGVLKKNDAGKDVYVPTLGTFNSEQMPSYHRLDVKLTMPFFGIKGFSSFIQFVNLFNHKNVTEYYYNDEYTERKEQKMLPFMMIAGLRFEF